LAQVRAKASKPRVAGYHILRRVKPQEAPWYPLDPQVEYAILGTVRASYFVPAGIDVFELGLIDRAGPFELLPIMSSREVLWDQTIRLLVTQAQAERQCAIVMRSYRALRGMLREAEWLEASVAEWTRSGTGPHPVFGLLRLAMIAVWKAKRRGCAPLSEDELDALHALVARRVAIKILKDFVR
jgi:hypothetical protein